MTAYSFVLLAVETVPLLFYIFMGLVVVSVPVAFIWDKYIQPGLDAKKKAQKDAERAEQEGESEPAFAAEADELRLGAMDELAMPAEGDEVEGDAPAAGAEPSKDLFGDAPAEEAAPSKDLFGDSAGADDLGEVEFEALPGDAFTEEPEEKAGG